MKLPPKPVFWREASESSWQAWGRACAEAALEAAATIVRDNAVDLNSTVWPKSLMLEGNGHHDAVRVAYATAIRNIKIED